MPGKSKPKVKPGAAGKGKTGSHGSTNQAQEERTTQRKRQHQAGESASSNPAAASSADSADSAEVRAFDSLPASVQDALTRYPHLVATAFQHYASTGSADDALQQILDGAPEMLEAVDHPVYKDSPLGRALLRRNPNASRRLMDLAERSGTAESVLGHRNSSGHTLLMLAVDMNSTQSEDLLRRLVKQDPTQVHRLYDSEGKNVFHHCAVDGLATSFRIILDALIETQAELSVNNIRAALTMTDRSEKSPIYYLAERGDVEMLNVLMTFALKKGVDVNYDTQFQSSTSLTPLMVAVQNGHHDVCRWLLDEKKGCVSVDEQQRSTCYTALHFAVERNDAQMVKILLAAGADPEFPGDEDDDDDDSNNDSDDSDDSDNGNGNGNGYKTPLALSEAKCVSGECRQLLLSAAQSQGQGHEATNVAAVSPSNQGAKSPNLPNKFVIDLHLFSTRNRRLLANHLASVGKSKAFVEALVALVPQLSFQSRFWLASEDPVYSAILELSDTDFASRHLLKLALVAVGEVDMEALFIPSSNI